MERIWVFLCPLLGVISACEIPSTSSLFVCPSYDNSRMKYSVPSIPESYFNYNISMLSSSLTKSREGHVYVFSTSPPNCRAEVAVLEFCYFYNYKENPGMERNVFDIISLDYEINQDKHIYFVKKSSLSVRSTPNRELCSSGLIPGQLLCCDVFSPENPFYLSSFAGVSVNNTHNLLIFKNITSNSEFLAQEYIIGAVDSLDSITTSSFCESAVEGLLVLKFVLESDSCLTACPSDSEVSVSAGATGGTTTSSSIHTRAHNADDTPHTVTITPANGLSSVSTVQAGGVSMPAILGGSVGAVIVIITAIALVGLCVFLVKKHSISTSKIESQIDAVENVAYKQGLVEQVYYSEPHFPTTDPDMAYAEVGPIVNGNNAEYFTLEPPQDYEQAYVAPAEDEQGLYAQLHNLTQAPIRASIRLGVLLGSGQFGAVYKGSWLSGNGDVEVAVKTLKEGSNEENRVKFLQEAAIMGQFKHSNIVTMHGIVTDGEPILLILELLEKGDLRGHLIASRPKEGNPIEIDGHCLLSYCRQVAAGMVYLSMKGFVHRDLAARNILVSEDSICKIADFGMSRDLADENYYMSHGGMIPVKWTAPEALYYKRYSTASDVWSYGVVLYEIWSLGHKPFEDLDNSKVLNVVDSGYRLPPPPGCPRSVYTLMISCWQPESSRRPTFESISQQLCMSDTRLLQWTKEEYSVHPEASSLGADLSSTHDLYEDLQQTYKD